jgi:hypothetical protein
MAHRPTLHVEHRRTVSWTLCIMAVYALKAMGLKMPNRLLLFFARRPIQYRVAGGRWHTYKLDPAELRRRLG